MSLSLQFCGATGEVTGSLYVLRTEKHTVLLECGLVQGGEENELIREVPVHRGARAQVLEQLLRHPAPDRLGAAPRRTGAVGAAMGAFSMPRSRAVPALPGAT